MTDTPTRPTGRPAAPETEGTLDLAEKGRSTDGKSISLDRRLFMQFMAFGSDQTPELIEKLKSASAQCVVYQDVNDPRGIGVMAFCEDPAYLVDTIHPILNSEDLLLEAKEEYTMLGRTYSIGYEPNLEDVLVTRSAKRVCDPQTPWVVYYPVRRSGQFERQSKEDQRKMLMEHGGIGHAYGKAGFATDIRLAGHGLNKSDNDFVIGLLGKELFPLSALVQHMRRTRQTSEFIESMGPFFVGRVLWQPEHNEKATLV